MTEKDYSQLNDDELKPLLHKWYIEEELPTQVIMKRLKLGRKATRARLKKFNLTRDPAISQRHRTEAQKKCYLEKYGVDSYSKTPEYLEKVKKTCLERYGVDNAAKAQEIKDKVAKNNLEKYGETNPLKVKAIKERVRLEGIEKRGFAYPLQMGKNPESILIMSDKNKLKEFIETFDHKPLLRELEEKLGYTHAYIKAKLFEYELIDMIDYIPAPFSAQRGIPDESIRIVTNKDNFREYLQSFEEKPTLKELSRLLDYDRTTIGQYIKEFELEEFVQYHKSQPERDIQALFPNVFKPNRQVIAPKEIDLYNEELKLGIEFNGNYWHSVDNKGYDYHKNKSLLAIEKGIRLIHIFEYEWENPSTREKLITLISNLVNDKRRIVYARKCEIREVQPKECIPFLIENHLQGGDRARVRLGLYFEEELVGVMTFSIPRFNKKYEWEISRLCFRSDVKVIGGAAKLFKHFVTLFNPSSVISYCDISKFSGEVYSSIGFEFSHYSNPNYLWCNEFGEYRTRYQCQKHKLIQEYPEYECLSETEIMTELGFWKVEDAGNAVYAHFPTN